MDLAVPVPSIFNSALVKKHATKEDPWGLDWTKSNGAGGGAYKVESWKPGQEVIYARYDDWKSGPLPKIRRVIQREIPSAGNRRALLEKGDIDMTYEMPPKDFLELSQGSKVLVQTTPIENSIWYLGMNVTKPPFDNPKVRQAVAYAIPYEKIMDSAMYKRATKLWDGAAVKSAAWPQPHRLQVRHSQGAAAHEGGRHDGRLRDDAVLRPGPGHRLRAGVHTHPGIARA